MIIIIAAVARNGVIGADGKLPWHHPKDLQHFKEVTMGQSLLFGRKTFESLGKKLEGRKISILTKDSNYRAEGYNIEVSVDNIIHNYLLSKNILYIAGGESVYRAFIGAADELMITHIEKDFEGDSYFPLEALKKFDACGSISVVDNGVLLRFVKYIKRLS